MSNDLKELLESDAFSDWRLNMETTEKWENSLQWHKKSLQYLNYFGSDWSLVTESYDGVIYAWYHKASDNTNHPCSMIEENKLKKKEV